MGDLPQWPLTVPCGRYSVPIWALPSFSAILSPVCAITYPFLFPHHCVRLGRRPLASCHRIRCQASGSIGGLCFRNYGTVDKCKQRHVCLTWEINNPSAILRTLYIATWADAASMTIPQSRKLVNKYPHTMSISEQHDSGVVTDNDPWPSLPSAWVTGGLGYRPSC